jgi:hypothetical protein
MWTKFLDFLSKAGVAVVKFLHWVYASELSFLVLACAFYLLVSKFVGVILVAWGVVLFISAYKQKQAAKTVVTPVVTSTAKV